MGNEVVRTEFRLDEIQFDVSSYEQLAGRTFRFPLNPIEGCIDGSVYIHSRHHPVDVTLIDFGTLSEETMRVRICGQLEYQDFCSNDILTLPFDWEVALRLPASSETIACLVDKAVKECGASSPKQMGQVMQKLKFQVHYEEQMADFAHAAKARLTLAR